MADGNSAILLPLVSLVSPLLIGALVYETLMRGEARILFAAVGFGLLATIPAIVVEAPFLVLAFSGNLPFRPAMTGVLIAASAIEEGIKLGAFFIVYAIFRARLRTGAASTVGACVAIAVGFAALEAVIYTFGIAGRQTADAWTITIVRSIATVPMHTLAGLIMGVYAARRLVHGDTSVANFAKMLGLPVLLHVSFNVMQIAYLPEQTRDDPALPGWALDGALSGMLLVYAVAVPVLWLTVQWLRGETPKS